LDYGLPGKKESPMSICVRTVSVLACFLLLASASVSFAELSAGQKQAVEALIKQFTAKEFAVRQAAVTRLKEFPFKLENVPVP
jgi:hypothetical protein